MDEDRKLYDEAMATVAESVDDVLEQLKDIADKNNYEFSWVVYKFRQQFNDKYNSIR